ncbi:MAG: class I SAM-dependent methyltransferase [Kofleriaceae bacterium]
MRSSLRGFARIGRWIDRHLFRHPFEGRSARRYARDERPAFGDLDDRLLDAIFPSSISAEGRLLDLGCGPGTFAARARVRYPRLTVIAVDPSRDFAAEPPHPDVTVIRAAGEALPLADATIDVAVMLSSIRHVKDRAATFAELRRVVTGRAFIVELDPAATRTQIAAHADHLGSALLRHTFGPLVVRTAPSAEHIESLAIAAGFTRRTLRVDPIQPVYILELV